MGKAAAQAVRIFAWAASGGEGGDRQQPYITPVSSWR